MLKAQPAVAHVTPATGAMYFFAGILSIVIQSTGPRNGPRIRMLLCIGKLKPRTARSQLAGMSKPKQGSSRMR
jgi:hypothetical protein